MNETTNPEFPIQAAATNAGLTAIDLASVIYLLKETGGPAQLIIILEGALAQVCEIGGSLAAAQVGLAAMAQERDEALEAVAHLQTQIERIDQTNPLIAALVRQVWDAAVKDTLKKVNRREKRLGA